MRRSILIGSCVAAAVGLAMPSSAAVPRVPVGVWQGPNDSVCVAVSEQVPQCTPGVGVAVGQLPQVPPNPVHVYRGPNGEICFSVSEQVPHCTPGTN